MSRFKLGLFAAGMVSITGWALYNPNTETILSAQKDNSTSSIRPIIVAPNHTLTEIITPSKRSEPKIVQEKIPSQPDSWIDVYPEDSFAEIGLTKQNLSGFFEQEAPNEIIYMSAFLNISKWQNPLPNTPQNRTLYLASTDATKAIREERLKVPMTLQGKNTWLASSASQGVNTETNQQNSRKKNSDVFSGAQTKKETNQKFELPVGRKLPSNSFSIVAFEPGIDDRGLPFIPTGTDFGTNLQGPDYSLDWFPLNDIPARNRSFGKLLTFGHGGKLLIKIEGGGLVNVEGPDFSIFENSFRIQGKNAYYQEFAYVGVSQEPIESNVTWFECLPAEAKVMGCAGAVPTSEGGDTFDLAHVGVEKAQYIWIRDIGTNKNKNFRNWPTEGCDIDAIHLINALED